MFDYFLLLGFLFGLVVVFLLTLHDLKWGVLLIPALLPSYLLRAQISWIPTTFLELSIYLVFAVALFKVGSVLLKSKSRSRMLRKMMKIFWNKAKGLHILALILFVTAMVGVIVSDDRRLSLGIVKAWFFDPLIYFYLLIFVLGKLEDLKKMFYLMIIPGVVLAFYGLIQYFTGDLLMDGRVRVVYESPNYVSLYFGPLIVIAFGLLLHNFTAKKKTWRFEGQWGIMLGLGLGILLMGFILFLTQSYAAWLAVFAGALIAIMLIPKRKWLYYFLILAGTILGLITQLSNPKLKAIFDFTGSSSMHKRLEIWQGSLAIIKDHWLFGIGLGKFQEIYREYIPRVFSSPPLDWQVLHSHNLFLMFWLNLGVIGFLAFLGILIYVICCFVKLAKNKRVFQKIRLEYFIFLGILVTILVHGLLDTPYWKNDLAILFWLVVGGVVWLYNFGLKRRAMK